MRAKREKVGVAGRFGVQAGPTDTERPDGLGGWVIPAMPVNGKLKIVGYYTQGKQPNWTRMKEYHDWKDHVRKHTALEIPAATAERPIRIDVWCYFDSKVHPDPENVRKGIVDALFKHRAGGDKYVFGYHHHPLYSDAPHVLVEISGDV